MLRRRFWLDLNVPRGMSETAMCPGRRQATSCRLVNFVWDGVCQLKLVRTSRHLLNLVRAGRHLFILVRTDQPSSSAWPSTLSETVSAYSTLSGPAAGGRSPPIQLCLGRLPPAQPCPSKSPPAQYDGHRKSRVRDLITQSDALDDILSETVSVRAETRVQATISVRISRR